MTEGSTRVAQLRTGEADLITSVSPTQLSQLEGQSGIGVTKLPSQSFLVLIMNSGRPPFNDAARSSGDELRGRQGSDHQNPARRQRHGVPAPGPAHEGYDKSLGVIYPYDPDKAKQLLSQAGLGSGFSITLDTPDGRYLQDKAIAEAIGGMLSKVGVQVKINPFEWGAFVKLLGDKTSDILLIQQGGSTTDSLLPTCFSSKIKGLPWLGYNNPEADALIDKARATVNFDERSKTYGQLIKLLQQDAPWVYLHYQTNIFGVRDRVKGFVPRPGRRGHGAADVGGLIGALPSVLYAGQAPYQVYAEVLAAPGVALQTANRVGARRRAHRRVLSADARRPPRLGAVFCRARLAGDCPRLARHGRSGRPADFACMSGMRVVEALQALLEQVGPAVLLTHSMSGAFGWKLAERVPELLRAVVGAAPSPPGNIQPWWSWPALPGAAADPLLARRGPPLHHLAALSRRRVRHLLPVDRSRKRANLQRAAQRARNADLPRRCGCCATYPNARRVRRYRPEPSRFDRRAKTAAFVGADHIALADRGLKDHGHLMMLEHGNLAVADIILEWLDRHVR